jgi:hypothetical protein
MLLQKSLSRSLVFNHSTTAINLYTTANKGDTTKGYPKNTGR